MTTTPTTPTTAPTCDEDLAAREHAQELTARVTAHGTLAGWVAQAINREVHRVPRSEGATAQVAKAAGRLLREAGRLVEAHAAAVAHAEQHGLDPPPAPDPRAGLGSIEAEAAVDAVAAGHDVAAAVVAARERLEQARKAADEAEAARRRREAHAAYGRDILARKSALRLVGESIANQLRRKA